MEGNTIWYTSAFDTWLILFNILISELFLLKNDLNFKVWNYKIQQRHTLGGFQTTEPEEILASVISPFLLRKIDFQKNIILEE